MVTRSDLQRLRSLRDKRHRQELGLFAVEGEKIVSELLSAGYRFEEVYATEAWAGEATHRLSEEQMSKASHFPTPSSVLAVGRIRATTPAPCEFQKGLTLALDGVQDPGNVGTLLRIADWFGLDRVLLSPGCADLHSQKVIQASMGSFARVRALVSELPAVLSHLPVAIIGCALSGEDVHGFEPPPDAVIVIGSEGRGLSAGVKEILTRTVTIPRIGAAESLNAAVAAAIICDNLRRRR